MPDNIGKALLTDIGTEELGHVEMLQTMIYQLIKDATLDELQSAGLDTHYAEHAKGLFPTDANGVPFTAAYFATTGDPLADISEDMAAEQKARAVYENLIDLTDDPDVIQPLLWLRQREIVHYARFKELFEYYQNKFKNNNQKVNNGVMYGENTKNYDGKFNDSITNNDFDFSELAGNNSFNTPSSLDITNGFLDNMSLDFTNMMGRRRY